MSSFANERISKISPYVPGEQPKDKKYIKLNTNESPFPPSQSAIEKIKMESERLMLYPDPDASELVLKIADYYGVDKNCIILSNGSDEVLNFAFVAFCDESTPAIFPDITYGFYKVFADINGVPCKEIPLRDDFTISIEDYTDENGVLFIANPNAPTGILLPLEMIEKLLMQNQNRLCVIDEAYIDFGGESCVPLIEKYDNLLVTQTFSKSRSMAGARLGVGFASPKIISDLVKVKYSTNPYNINRMTIVAGIGSMEDDDYFKSNCRKIIEARAFTESSLAEMGFSFTSSYTNFVFCKTPIINGKELYSRLKDKGILVRHFDKARISDYIRVTVGSLEEMKIFINTVKTILEELQ